MDNKMILKLISKPEIEKHFISALITHGYGSLLDVDGNYNIANFTLKEDIKLIKSSIPIEFIIDYNECFPKNKRHPNSVVIEKFNVFFRTVLKIDITKNTKVLNDIIAATKIYIGKTSPTYISKSGYFIYKYDNNKILHSKLMDELYTYL